MTDNSHAAKPQLPESLLDILRQAAESDAGWWVVARAMADYIAELPAAIAHRARAIAIRDAAIARGVVISTMNDAVRTAMTITYRVEDDPLFAPLCWQHFVRAARIGDNDKAIQILRIILIEMDNYAGQRPPVTRVNELVNEANGHKPPKRRRWSYTVVSVAKRKYGPVDVTIRIEAGNRDGYPQRGDMGTALEVPESDE